MTQCGRVLRSSTAGLLLCLRLLTIKVPLNWTQCHLSSSGYTEVELKQLCYFLGLPNGKNCGCDMLFEENVSYISQCRTHADPASSY